MKLLIVTLLLLAGCKEKEPKPINQYIIECDYGLTDYFSRESYEIGQRIPFPFCVPDSAFVRAEIISTNQTFNQIRRALVEQRKVKDTYRLIFKDQEATTVAYIKGDGPLVITDSLKFVTLIANLFTPKN